MGMETVLGISLVIVGGLIMGAGAWPMKLMRTFQFEHWWFLAMLFGSGARPVDVHSGRVSQLLRSVARSGRSKML